MNVKIRFVKRKNRYGETEYLMQHRKFFIWRYVSFVERNGFYVRDFLICSKSKKELLKTYIEDVLKSNGKHVQITEYPSLKLINTNK